MRVPLPGLMAHYLLRCEQFAEAPPRHLYPCPGCNATKVTWVTDRLRPGARVAACTRCGSLRRADYHHGILLYT